MGTKCSCQAKCFVLLALLSPPHTLSSGRTFGYLPPNPSSNYLDTQSLLLGGTSVQLKQALPMVNSYLLDTEIISCTKHRSMSIYWSKAMFSASLPCKFFAGWPVIYQVSCSWCAKKTWSRPGGGKRRQGWYIRCAQTSGGVLQSLKNGLNDVAVVMWKMTTSWWKWTLPKISLNLWRLIDLQQRWQGTQGRY